MMVKPIKALSIIFAVLLYAALLVLAVCSLAHQSLSSAYTRSIAPLWQTMVAVDDGQPRPITLPAKLSGLSPRTPVRLYARADIAPGDSLLLKAVFTPLKLFVNGVLIYESGQEGSYPPYMNDPPTSLVTIPLGHTAGTVDIVIDYLSLSQRSTLVLPLLSTGNEAALIAHVFSANSLSFFFSFMLMLIGIGMVLISFALIRKVAAGSSFLWLGLFSMCAGIWVFGECDLSVLLVPYPSLLYNMAYMGLFTLTIPFLKFGLVILKPKNKQPFQVMLMLHSICLSVAIALQFAGVIDFTKSLYWFHILAPLGFVVFALCLAWEHFRHHNPTAKRFAPAVWLIAASTLLEVTNYWLHFTGTLTMFFQFGTLAFIIALGYISGLYVRESLYTAAEKARLEYEMSATTRLLELQRMQYQQMAQSDAAIKAQRHDLRHQLTVVGQMNAQGEHEKLARYIDTLIGSIPSAKENRLCENYAVNAVAAYYAATARQEAIPCHINLVVLQDTGLVPESDLCIIIGNLLENALEACRRMPEGPRFIRMNSRFEHGLLTITLDNSFDGCLVENEGVLLSAKRSGEGTGLASVKAIAAKHGGATRFEGNAGVFLSSVYVRLHNIIVHQAAN